MTWLTFLILLAVTVPATPPLVPDTHLRGGGVRHPDDRDIGIYKNAAKALVLAGEEHRVADSLCWAKWGAPQLRNEGRGEFGGPCKGEGMGIRQRQSGQGGKVGGRNARSSRESCCQGPSVCQEGARKGIQTSTGCRRHHPRWRLSGVSEEVRRRCGRCHRGEGGGRGLRQMILPSSARTWTVSGSDRPLVWMPPPPKQASTAAGHRQATVCSFCREDGRMLTGERLYQPPAGKVAQRSAIMQAATDCVPLRTRRTLAKLTRTWVDMDQLEAGYRDSLRNARTALLAEAEPDAVQNRPLWEKEAKAKLNDHVEERRYDNANEAALRANEASLGCRCSR